jgi:hypothetical protein
MTDMRLGAFAALACAATLSLSAADAATVNVGATLPALGSPEAAKLPAIDSGKSIAHGPDVRTLDLKHWKSWHPARSPGDEAAIRYALAKGPNGTTTLPYWTASVNVGKKTYAFQMLGSSPLTKGAGTTKINVVIVPLVFIFNNGTLDATHPIPGCSPAGADTMIAQSPLFQNAGFKSGNISIGKSQFVDLFQRQNFWGYIAKKSPNYHVLFAGTETPAIKVTVNGANATPTACNNGAAEGGLGTVDNTQFDALIRDTLIPQLKKYISPKVLPIFLAYDVVFGGAAGYHDAYPVKGGIQVYGVTTYLDVGNSAPDAEVASHEFAEATDDPFVQNGGNATPPWGHTGQVTGCQSNLEVGDPLTGQNWAFVKMPNGYTYEVTDLANFSWFYEGSPSIAANGFYTMFNFFPTSAVPCH